MDEARSVPIAAGMELDRYVVGPKFRSQVRPQALELLHSGDKSLEPQQDEHERKARRAKFIREFGKC